MKGIVLLRDLRDKQSPEDWHRLSLWGRVTLLSPKEKPNKKTTNHHLHHQQKNYIKRARKTLSSDYWVVKRQLLPEWLWNQVWNICNFWCFLRIPSNCQRTITLLTFDPDGDEVRCRYASSSSSECNICTPPSVLSLSSVSKICWSWYILTLAWKFSPRDWLDYCCNRYAC